MARPSSTPRTDETAAVIRKPPPPLGVMLRVHGVRASEEERRLAGGRCVVGAGTDADLILEDGAQPLRQVA